MTEANLNAKNKGYVVARVLDLQQQLESATAGALTAATLERKVLDLKRKVISVRDNALQRKQEYEVDVAQINFDTDIRLRELELEYSTSNAVEGTELSDLFKSLEFQANKAEKDLTFGLKEAETDVNEKLIKIKEKVEKAEIESEKALVNLTNSVLERTSESLEESMKLKTNHSRDMEALKYENSIAIRDELLGTAVTIAQKYNSTLVDDDELRSLEDIKQTTEEDLKSEIGKAVGMAESKLKREKDALYDQLKGESSTKIQLLENDITHLVSAKNTAEARIADLEAQIKTFPVQMKEALGAAKTEIVNNIDAAKK